MFRIRSNAVFVEMSIRESKAQATPSEPPAGPQHCYSPLPLHTGGVMIHPQTGTSNTAHNFALALEAQLFGEPEY